MGGFNGRDNSLHFRKILKGLYRLQIRYRHILCPSAVMECCVLRSDSGIIQSRGNGVYRGNLSEFILTEVGLHAVENAQLSYRNGGRSFLRIHPSSCGLTANQLYTFIRNKMVEGSDSIGASSHAGQYCCRKLSFSFQNFFSNLLGNHRLKIPDHGREGVRSHNGTEAVVGIGNSLRPLSHGLRHRIL